MKFAEWLRTQEMVGTGAIYDGTKGKDFNWWGSPESMNKPMKSKKRKKKK